MSLIQPKKFRIWEKGNFKIPRRGGGTGGARGAAAPPIF